MSVLNEKTGSEAGNRSFNDDATVNCDVASRHSISGLSTYSSKKEIDKTQESTVVRDPETNDRPPSEDDDVPDGGLRAWLVILGVSCHIAPYLRLDLSNYLYRCCIVFMWHSHHVWFRERLGSAYN